MKIFKENRKFIDDHNEKFDKNEETYKLDVNEFADLSFVEFDQLMNGYRRPANETTTGTVFAPPKNSNTQELVDWRGQGAVTPVKNQGQCGSCWSFAATGSLEGQNYRKTGKLVSLSEQNLIDCSKAYSNNGCSGGWTDRAYQYIKDNNGVDTEQSYPYEGVDNQLCRFNGDNIGATVIGIVNIKSGDENALKQAVAAVGPISVAIDVRPSFQFYSAGIYYDKFCSTVQVNHGVVVVGYGTENGQDYWLVKNSWGTSYGEKGYIRMARNKRNNCAIATYASYPMV